MIAQRNHSVFSRRPSVNPRIPAPPQHASLPAPPRGPESIASPLMPLPPGGLQWPVIPAGCLRPPPIPRPPIPRPAAWPTRFILRRRRNHAAPARCRLAIRPGGGVARARNRVFPVSLMAADRVPRTWNRTLFTLSPPAPESAYPGSAGTPWNPESMAVKRTECPVSWRPRCRTFHDQLRLKAHWALATWFQQPCGSVWCGRCHSHWCASRGPRRGPQAEQAKRPEVAATHCYGGMRRKIQLPGFAICLPWIHDYSPGAEAARAYESGAAVSGYPDRRSGWRVSANRNVPAAAPGKVTPGGFHLLWDESPVPER